MSFPVLFFVVELQKVRTKCISSIFLERTGAIFKVACMWKGEESIKKPVFTEFGRSVIKMVLKKQFYFHASKI